MSCVRAARLSRRQPSETRALAACAQDNTIALWNDAEKGGSECTYADALMDALPAVLAAAKDPLESFCDTNPSDMECKVYDD